MRKPLIILSIFTLILSIYLILSGSQAVEPQPNTITIGKLVPSEEEGVSYYEEKVITEQPELENVIEQLKAIESTKQSANTGLLVTGISVLYVDEEGQKHDYLIGKELVRINGVNYTTNFAYYRNILSIYEALD